jgi:uncharacterized membrane protein
MTRIEKQVVIARPIEDVLRFAREWRNIPRYLDYIQAVKPLTEITEGTGARFLINLTYLGRKMTSEWETIEYAEGEGWTFEASLMGIKARKRWRFEAVGESTRATFTLEYEPEPAVVGPLVDAVLFRPKWDKLYERGMQNLKRVLESERVGHAAAA